MPHVVGCSDEEKVRRAMVHSLGFYLFSWGNGGRVTGTTRMSFSSPA
jgi:hypothetical protein